MRKINSKRNSHIYVSQTRKRPEGEQQVEDKQIKYRNALNERDMLIRKK
jgi:hypothetical protein